MRLASCILLLLCMTLWNIGWASTLPSRLKCASDTFEPYVIETSQYASLQGVNVELVENAASLLGIEIEFNRVPWARLEQALKDNQVDCAVAFFLTPERAQSMNYTRVPIQFTSYNLFTHTGTLKKGWGTDQIKGWQIGYHRGFLLPQELTQLADENAIKLVALQSEEQALAMLVKHRLNALITNKDVGLYLLKKNNWHGIEVISPAFSYTPAYLVFSKKDGYEGFIPLFDEALFELMKNGRYAQIRQQYGLEQIKTLADNTDLSGVGNP